DNAYLLIPMLAGGGNGLMVDAVTGKVLYELSEVTGVTWSPDGKQFALDSSDGTTTLYDAATGEAGRTLEGVRPSWSPDGTRIITNVKAALDFFNPPDPDAHFQIWDANTGDPLITLIATSDMVCGEPVRWSPDSMWLENQCSPEIVFWESMGGNQVREINGQFVGWSPDGKQLLMYLVMALSADLQVLDMNTGAILYTLVGSAESTEAAFSADGHQIMTWSARDTTVRLWAAFNGKQIAPGGDGIVVMSPDEHWLARRDYAGVLHLRDLTTGEERVVSEILPSGDYAVQMRLFWSPDSKQLAALDGGTAIIYDVQSGKELFQIRDDDDQIGSLAWSPDGKQIATGHLSMKVKLWNAADGKTLAQPVNFAPEPTQTPTPVPTATPNADTAPQMTIVGDPAMAMADYVTDVMWSPDGTRLLTTTISPVLTVYDATTGKVLYTIISNYETGGAPPAWSPDGTKIVGRGTDNTVIIWEAASGHELMRLKGHNQRELDAIWSPDGHRIASLGQDYTVRIWDVMTGSELALFPNSSYQKITWSREGQQLYGLGYYNDLNAFPVWENTADLITYARDCCAIRPLTNNERSEFNLPTMTGIVTESPSSTPDAVKP
ncbi:MAG TPA: hypothetical protein VHL11_17605, partial [Phototrophicaceae bacterium]|nr:hypothetical protein [Phototrophicaceae bacterium]